MRKIMSAVLVTAMAVSLAACSSAPVETEAPTTAAETEDYGYRRRTGFRNVESDGNRRNRWFDGIYRLSLIHI